MNKKGMGTAGELAVAKYLLDGGYNVFKELGDNSRIDLIAERSGELLKIQVKTTKSKNGSVSVDLVKFGPGGYSYTYTERDIDIFAVYVYDRDVVLFIPVALSSSRGICFRFDPARNGQTKNIRMAEDYMNLDDIRVRFL